jgi:HJR/Mrr/RecB family endonuclease
METIDRMSGKEFEEYVAARFRQSGWDVCDTPATGDFGVDLVAKKGGQWFAVQCKRSGKPIGIPAVQQVFSGAAHYHCKASMVVSNQEFTPAAKALAGLHNCVLIGRSKLPMTVTEWGL